LNAGHQLPERRRMLTAGHLQARPWARADARRRARRPLPGGACPAVSRRCAGRRSLVMATHALGYAPEDPIALVESCYRALQWLLATRTARGLLIPRPWIDHPYGEEEITLLEEELLPAMAVFLARVEAIDRAIEADQESAAQALAAAVSR